MILIAMHDRHPSSSRLDFRRTLESQSNVKHTVISWTVTSLIKIAHVQKNAQPDRLE